MQIPVDRAMSDNQSPVIMIMLVLAIGAFAYLGAHSYLRKVVWIPSVIFLTILLTLVALSMNQSYQY
jgi:hypothetical protein